MSDTDNSGPFGIERARTATGFHPTDWKINRYVPIGSAHEAQFVLAEWMYDKEQAEAIRDTLNRAYRLGKGTLDKFERV